MIRNALFLWIGELYSTLFFKQWNEESGIVYQMEGLSGWSAFAKMGPNILVGQYAIKAQALNQVSVFYMGGKESNNLNPQTGLGDREDFTEIDQQAILLRSMLKRLAPKVKELCGIDSEEIETLYLLDPGNFFSDDPQRLVGAIGSVCCSRGFYYSREEVLTALGGVTEKDAPVFVIADETRENQAELPENCESALSVTKLFNVLLEDLNGSFRDTSQALQATVRLMEQVEQLGDGDGLEIIGGYHARQVWPLVVDSLHFYQALGTCMYSQSDPVRDDQVIIGDFSKVYLRERTQSDNSKGEAWSRREVISRFPGKIDTLPTVNEDKLQLSINTEQCDLPGWETRSKALSGCCSQSINLFGNTRAEIEVQLADSLGPIVSYSFELTSDQPINTANYELELRLYRGGAIACELLPMEPLGVKLADTRHYRKDASWRKNNLLDMIVNIN